MTTTPSPSPPPLAPDPGSFRDPRSRVFVQGHEVIRLLDERGAADFAAFEATPLFARAQADGRVVRTSRRPLPPGVDHRWQAALDHDRVPAVSYPYEWSFSMLQDAALLHLDLVAEALPHGLTSKDGSSLRLTRDVTVRAKGDLVLSNDGGASITLRASGEVEIRGTRIQLRS